MTLLWGVLQVYIIVVMRNVFVVRPKKWELYRSHFWILYYKFYSQTNLYEAQSHSKGLYTGITSFTSIMRSQILIF